MTKENWTAQVLEASLANPNDSLETTIITDAASVGTTLPLHGSKKKVKLTEEFLRSAAGSFKGMPITLQFENEDGEDSNLTKHSKTIIGHIRESYFDEAKKKVITVGALHKHFFPETIKRLTALYASEDPLARPQVSWELQPDEVRSVEGEDEDTLEPISGRFAGQAIINKGADLGNAITLLAAAAESEQQSMEDSLKKPNFVAGSFEWIAENIANYLSIGSNVDNFKDTVIVGTYPDGTVYQKDGKTFKLPYTIEGTDIKFSDTIEVEPTYQPLGASAAGSDEETPEATPPTAKEAGNSNMVDIDEKELESLRAAAALATELESENETLKASVAEGEAFKASVEEERAEQTKANLAASRLAQVEQIIPYTDPALKAADLEAFKAMPEDAFGIVTRTLQAAAEVRGGVAPEATISNPHTSREDPDGAGATILNDPVYQSIKAGFAAPKEDS